ncbi:hypothetical protein BI347_18780 [Chromobacterium sphagni]|uniref:N-acetyltransferase domain-containing protein n=1 Tax=Chromobacterium sphagni TaxID=1903179 RepID=A0A1S1WWN3_9NEIS|nr:hypothetical protein BI347_18780 [Chromobacterium sphagni]OHX15534.1 hypothetical protein BI344_22055 [Chromobacterium sphagni]
MAAIQQRAEGRKLISSTEDWCIASQRMFQQLGWQKIGALDNLNKDGSSEFFYAVDLLAASQPAAGNISASKPRQIRADP